MAGQKRRDGAQWSEAPSPRGRSNGRRDNRIHGAWVPKGMKVEWVWTHEQEYSVVTGFELKSGSGPAP